MLPHLPALVRVVGKLVFWAAAVVIFSATLIIKGLALSQTNATEGPGWERLPGAAAVVVSLFFISPFFPFPSIADGFCAVRTAQQPTLR